MNKPNVLRILLFIPVITLAFSASAQKYQIFFSTGIGTYKMNDLKNLQIDLINQSPISLNEVNNFPAHLQFQGGLGIPVGRNAQQVGFLIDYKTTGSRAGSKDYSGYYQVDQIVQSIGFGAFFKQPLIDLGYLKTSIRANVNYQSTTLDIISDYKVFDASVKDEINFISDGLELGINFLVEKELGPFSLFASAGYGHNVYDSLKFKEDKDAELILNESTIGADWSGIRANLGIALNL